MPRNGSGVATLAQAPFVPNTPISSSAMNSDLSDIANMLTGSVASDGQTTITGQLKGTSGSVGLPAYSFSADLDSGIYRIGANNIGISVNATKILDIGVGGLTTTYLVQPSGTALLPTYTFAGDLDSGIYSVGANEIGVAVNGAQVLDISTAGLNVIGSISSNGAAFSPTAQGAGMVNGTIVESHSGNAVTFALKTFAGNDPSPTDPVFFLFRSGSAASGAYSTIQLTAAASIVVSSGSTLGTASTNRPFRIWIVMFNDAGTLRLGVINCLEASTSAPIIFPLGAWEIDSAVAEGGAGAADNARTFYAGAAITSKPYLIVGYASYETGVTTAGSWAVSPTRIQLFGVDVPRPGTPLQTLSTITTTTGSTSSTSFAALSSGPTLAITPSSAANLIEVSTNGVGSTAGGSTTCQMQFQRTVSAVTSVVGYTTGYVANASPAPVSIGPFFDFPGLAATSTYAIQGKVTAFTMNYPSNTFGGAVMTLREIMC